MTEETITTIKRTRRSFKGRMTCTSIRLPQDVIDFYKVTYGDKMQNVMRQVLKEFITTSKE